MPYSPCALLVWSIIPTQHHTEAGLHSDDKVVETKEVHVEQHEEHCNEGEEAEQKGQQESTQVVPTLAQSGGQQPCKYTHLRGCQN